MILEFKLKVDVEVDDEDFRGTEEAIKGSVFDAIRDTILSGYLRGFDHELNYALSITPKELELDGVGADLIV